MAEAEEEALGALLCGMGVAHASPEALDLLLRFRERWCRDTLTEALVLAQHAGRQDVAVEDVRLALQLKVDVGFAPPRPIESLLRVASQVNRGSLPEVPSPSPETGSYVVLPPHGALNRGNYQCLKRAAVADAADRPLPTPSSDLKRVRWSPTAQTATVSTLHPGNVFGEMDED
eukprot:EG_transcript_31437